MAAHLERSASVLPPGVAARIDEVLAGVPDPEIPVLSVIDLGIIRDVGCDESGAIRIGVSPTYSGCPATAVIKQDIVAALRAVGFAGATAYDVLSPAWTSDWISADGHRKLREYGIAPPARGRHGAGGERQATCPRCGSRATERISEFGSTPCKALYRCTSCLEPFDQFKCI
jgi:ring-1,2-phenylacetyl-CoA epoxidase subunit PaaD